MSAKHESHNYQIVVQGHLDDRWKNWFEGLTIKRRSVGVTEFIGEIVDQSALFGILNRLNDIGLELISVHRYSKFTEGKDSEEEI